MSAVNAPFGLRPINSGAQNHVGAVRTYDGAIASGYANAMYTNTPVTMVAGQIVPVTAVTDKVLGSFQGVDFTATTGGRVTSKYWPAGQVTLATGAPTRVYIAHAEDNVFEIQGNGVINEAQTGGQINFTAADITPPVAGSVITGLSSARANVTPVATTVQGQMQILGQGYEPDNAFGDAFTIVRVKIADGQQSAAYPVP